MLGQELARRRLKKTRAFGTVHALHVSRLCVEVRVEQLSCVGSRLEVITLSPSNRSSAGFHDLTEVVSSGCVHRKYDGPYCPA
jgi:hypothetical protein